MHATGAIFHRFQADGYILKYMMLEFIHSTILIITIALAFLFGRSGLGQYNVQIIAGLFIVLYIGRRLVINRKVKSYLLESVVFTFVITLVVATTGAAHSPYFFLLYFLLFSLALLLEPIIAITTALSLIVILLFSLPDNQTFSSLIPVFSLAFLTPFALILGDEYSKNKQANDQIDALEQSFGRSRSEIFLFLALVVKQHIRAIQDAIDTLDGPKQIEAIRHSVHRIYSLIDKFEKRLSSKA